MNITPIAYAQAAHLLQCSVRQIQKLVQYRKLRAAKFGRVRCVAHEDVQALIEYVFAGGTVAPGLMVG